MWSDPVLSTATWLPCPSFSDLQLASLSCWFNTLIPVLSWHLGQLLLCVFGRRGLQLEITVIPQDLAHVSGSDNRSSDPITDRIVSYHTHVAGDFQVTQTARTLQRSACSHRLTSTPFSKIPLYLLLCTLVLRKVWTNP